MQSRPTAIFKSKTSAGLKALGLLWTWRHLDDAAISVARVLLLVNK